MQSNLCAPNPQETMLEAGLREVTGSLGKYSQGKGPEIEAAPVCCIRHTGCQCLALQLPISRTGRNAFQLFISQTV